MLVLLRYQAAGYSLTLFVQPSVWYTLSHETFCNKGKVFHLHKDLRVNIEPVGTKLTLRGLDEDYSHL